MNQQSSESIEKNYFQYLQPGEYIDFRSSENEWKLAKVIQRENKRLTIMCDGYSETFVCSPLTQQVDINTMRVKPMRAETVGYTGPEYPNLILANLHALNKYFLPSFDEILNGLEAVPVQRVTQFLRGELFCAVNELLWMEGRPNNNEAKLMNDFLYGF
jgi:hypothetical protein